MKPIIILSPKGGVGKSTIVGLLALEIKRRGKTCAIIDWDTQHSSSDFLETHGDNEHIFNHKELGDKEVDFLLIDSPGNVETYANILEQIDHSARIVIPCDSSRSGLRGVVRIQQELGQGGRGQKRMKKAILVWNNIKKGTNNENTIPDWSEQIQKMGIRIAETILHQKVKFQYAVEEPEGLKKLTTGESFTIYDLAEEVL
jgi:cellulose biosynthesis protein BcsQ